MQLLGGSITEQILDMRSEIKVTAVTSLQHPAAGTVSGVEFGRGSTPIKPYDRSSKVSSGRMETYLPWRRRAKACSILGFSMNTDHESRAS